MGEYASIVDDGTSTCRNLTTPATFTSFDLEANVNRPSKSLEQGVIEFGLGMLMCLCVAIVRFYNKPCGSLGGAGTITLGPGQQPNGCFAFDIASYQFL